MRSYGRHLVLLAALGVAAPVLALPEASSDDLEHNRKLLEKWRQDPGHYARLKEDLRAFAALPPEKQERLRKLDQELHEEDSATQTRLWRVLDRYVTWLDRLKETDPNDWQRINDAEDPKERLQRIKEVRDRQWVDRLPRPLRERVQAESKDKRPKVIEELRKKERERNLEWQLANRHNQPRRLADFPPEVQTFVQESLRPVLGPEERQQLKNAEGQWPLYARTLVELADRHPVILPGSPAGPTRPQLLMGEAQRFFKTLPPSSPTATQRRRLSQVEGKWPDYGITLTELARNAKVQLPPFGPCKPENFSPAVREFIDKTLMKKLSEQEQTDLKKEEGMWPEYPRMLLQLSRQHKLEIPGMKLPGPREFWDNLRAALPDVPDKMLSDFALTELSPRELAEMQLSVTDPSSRDRLTKEFFKRKPDVLQRFLFNDSQKQNRKKPMDF